MPNQDFLNLFEIFGRPAHGGKVSEPGILQNASYALRTAWRLEHRARKALFVVGKGRQGSKFMGNGVFLRRVHGVACWMQLL